MVLITSRRTLAGLEGVLRSPETACSSRPGWTMAHLAARLSDADRRLATLTAGDLGGGSRLRSVVRAALRLDPADLPAALPGARGGFRHAARRRAGAERSARRGGAPRRTRRPRPAPVRPRGPLPLSRPDPALRPGPVAGGGAGQLPAARDRAVQHSAQVSDLAAALASLGARSADTSRPADTRFADLDLSRHDPPSPSGPFSPALLRPGKPVQMNETYQL